MTANPRGSPHRATPDAQRGTVNARFRVRPDCNDIVRRLAVEHSDTATNVATALLIVGASHEDEFAVTLGKLREALAARREGQP